MSEKIKASSERTFSKGDWHPIHMAPYRELVDLWCIYGDESSATYESGNVIGVLVSRRHKSEEYGWFGNQSNDGVPQANGSDLVPVAWRYAVPDCPAYLIEQAMNMRAKAGAA